MAGASPKSLLMAVKVGDTYVVHSENLAQGVVYAADHGADVINTSLGATGNSKLLRAAATYAYSKGVFWAAATANEYSTHHNYPTNLDTVAGAGGLGPELADPTIQTCQSVGSAGATNCAPANPQTTFLQKVNYANYGGHPDLRHPDRHGRDEPRRHGLRPPPVGHLDGHAAPGGRGRDRAKRRLPRRPVRRARRHRRRAHRDRLQPADRSGGAQLQRGAPAARLHGHARPQRRRRRAATNNYPPNPSGDPTPAGGEYYPEQGGDPHRGWNIWAGFGRPDIYAAAAYAEQGLIPPEAQLFGDQPPPGPAFAGLKGPVPFAVYDPAKTPTLTIVGHVAAPRLKAGADASPGRCRSLPASSRPRRTSRTSPVGPAPRRRTACSRPGRCRPTRPRSARTSRAPASTRSRSPAPTPSGS